MEGCGRKSWMSRKQVMINISASARLWNWLRYMVAAATCWTHACSLVCLISSAAVGVKKRHSLVISRVLNLTRLAFPRCRSNQVSRISYSFWQVDGNLESGLRGYIMLIVCDVWIQSTGALLSDGMGWQPDLGTQQRREVCRISEIFNSTASSRTLCCSFSTTTWIPWPDLLNQAKLFFTAICMFLFLAKAICIPVVFTLIIH